MGLDLVDQQLLVGNLVFSSFVFDSFAQHAQFHTIYTDFTKAFDQVNHNTLINILSNYGFGEPILSWFSSYLTNRKQYVKLYDSTSNIITPSSGVPQDAFLSPLLFSLLVNSVASVLRNARLLIFADDIKFVCVFIMRMMLVFFKLTLTG